MQLPTVAKPPQAGLLSGSHLAFAVCGLVLAPELAVDAVQAIPYVAGLLLAFLALYVVQDAITHWPTSSTPWPGTIGCPAAGFLCLAPNMNHINCCLLLASLIMSNICLIFWVLDRLPSTWLPWLHRQFCSRSPSAAFLQPTSWQNRCRE